MNTRPPPIAGYRPDFRFGNTIVEVKSDLHSFRNLRAALLQLAYYITEDVNTGDVNLSGALVLASPRITGDALREEWRMIERTIRPALFKRLTLAVIRDAEISVIAGQLTPRQIRQILPNVDQETRQQPYRAPQSSDAIILTLINGWLLRQGPMTTQWLMRAVGCSYPTAARVLRRLEAVIKRHSDRRFQLWGFPTEEWQRVVANRERSHPTIHYVDRSGQPRNAETLLKRAATLNRDDLAVGGVIAARKYYPDLNLRGTPRLDLTLHSPDGKTDLTFIDDLDPALERTSGANEGATLAIHVLRRQDSFFERSGGGLPCADRVSTVLDLYDARLDSQATEFLEHLISSVG